MTQSRALRIFAALAAMFGIALQALWPLLAQARTGRSISVPICSVDGFHRSVEIPIDGGKTGKSSGHCKLCLLGGERTFVANSLPVFGISTQSFEAFPRVDRESFKSSASSSARPRAPPVSL